MPSSTEEREEPITMRSISRRLRRLEESHLAQKNELGLTPVDVLRQRICRRQAAADRMRNCSAKGRRRPKLSGQATTATARSLVSCGIAERWSMRRRWEIEGHDRAFFDAIRTKPRNAGTQKYLTIM